MNEELLKKYDLQKMYKIYDVWPKIAKDSFKKELKSLNFKNIKHIVFAGMGGSGTVGDIFASILSKKKIHLDIVKGYVLPKTVNSNSLVIVISVSGNTLETLTILEKARKIGCKILTFSSGGKIEKYCKFHKINFIKIRKYHSPRATLPSYLYSILKVLHKSLDIEKKDIVDSIDALETTRKKIYSKNFTNNNIALQLASFLKITPMIYYPHGLQSVAIRFKNSIQENSKMHAASEDIIESCHNGIVSWRKNSNFVPILIRGNDDNEKTKERWDIVKSYFELKGIPFFEINSISGNILGKIIQLIYVLDYSSIYLAVMNHENPSPVEAIDYIKSKLN